MRLVDTSALSGACVMQKVNQKRRSVSSGGVPVTSCKPLAARKAGKIEIILKMSEGKSIKEKCFPEGVIRMSIAQLSPNSILVAPSQVNAPTQSVQHAALAQASQAAQGALVKTKTDTVTISSQAATMNSRASRLAEESREDGTERTTQKKRRQG